MTELAGFPRRTELALVALPWFLVACGGGPGPSDVGRAQDAGTSDAGTDSGIDAGTDSGTSDAGTDSGTLDSGASDAGASLDGGPAAADTCRTNADCTMGDQCMGLGEAGVGRCRDLTPIPGEGAECASDLACGPSLICTQTRPGGACVPAWMLDTFPGGSVEIPDDDPSGITVSIDAFGLATVATEVVLRFRIEHGRSSDLRVYITNPSGTEALAWDGNASGEPVVPVRDIERIVANSGDESVNGRWLLRAVDLDPAETGRLLQWSVTLRSRFD